MTDLMLQGVELMVVGMGVVFTFLSLLVVAIGVMTRVIERFAPLPQQDLSPDEVAAISAAIARYESDRRATTRT